MTAAIDAPVGAMSRGQLEAAVTLLRQVADAARRYYAAVESEDPVLPPAAVALGETLDRELLKVGMP